MLLLVTCTSALLRVRFPTCTDVHLKRFCVHNILCTKNYDLWGPGWTKSKIRWFYLLLVYSSLMVYIIYVKLQFPCCFFFCKGSVIHSFPTSKSIRKSSQFVNSREHCAEQELRVRDMRTTNQFLDPTNQKFVKLPLFANRYFSDIW